MSETKCGKPIGIRGYGNQKAYCQLPVGHSVICNFNPVTCDDCGRPYGEEFGFPDLVVPDDVWNNFISPTGNEGGMLCPSCMCKVAFEKGVKTTAAFRSGAFAGETATAPPANEASS